MWLVISEQGIQIYQQSRSKLKKVPDTCLIITSESTPRYEEHWTEGSNRQRGVERVPKLRFRVYVEKQCLFDTQEITIYEFIRALGLSSRDLNIIMTHARAVITEPVPKPARFNEVMRKIKNKHDYVDPDRKYSSALHYICRVMDKLGYDAGIRTFCDIGSNYGPEDEFAPAYAFGDAPPDWLFARDKATDLVGVYRNKVPAERRKKANRRH